ncbi:hypothetical protein ACIEGN_18705 [Citrobacter freundii]|uniref:hypothetical protein n=1 Tax=Citrobacter freundii TaxID=546 RepID=UPI0037CC8F17
MNVKRYEWVACDEHVCHCDVVESAEGDMVDYEDYAALEAICAALAAENAGLKAGILQASEDMEAHHDDHGLFSYDADGEQMDALLRLCDAQDSIASLENVKTPSTDAFLAEVRAHGVERLANAWYAIANETDPGISISDSSRLKYRQRADDAADFANEIRQEAAQ